MKGLIKHIFIYSSIAAVSIAGAFAVMLTARDAENRDIMLYEQYSSCVENPLMYRDFRYLSYNERINLIAYRCN